MKAHVYWRRYVFTLSMVICDPEHLPFRCDRQSQFTVPRKMRIRCAWQRSPHFGPDSFTAINCSSRAAASGSQRTRARIPSGASNELATGIPVTIPTRSPADPLLSLHRGNAGRWERRPRVVASRRPEANLRPRRGHCRLTAYGCRDSVPPAGRPAAARRKLGSYAMYGSSYSRR